MSKKSDAWMPLYVGDYMADTSHLTTEQHGAYMLILLALWKRAGAGLPDADENLAAAARLPLSRWKAIRPLLIDGSLLRTDGKTVTQKRLDAEITKARGITEARASAGAKGGATAQANRKQTGQANDKQTGQANAEQTSTPSPSPPIPSEAIASGADAPPPPTPPSDRDLVFANGVALLTAAGVVEKNARSFLAGACKTHGEKAVLEALRACARDAPIQPIPWLQAVLQPRQRASKHAGFAGKDYRAGVTDDGLIAT